MNLFGKILQANRIKCKTINKDIRQIAPVLDGVV